MNLISKIEAFKVKPIDRNGIELHLVYQDDVKLVIDAIIDTIIKPTFEPKATPDKIGLWLRIIIGRNSNQYKLYYVTHDGINYLARDATTYNTNWHNASELSAKEMKWVYLTNVIPTKDVNNE